MEISNIIKKLKGGMDLYELLFLIQKGSGQIIYLYDDNTIQIFDKEPPKLEGWKETLNRNHGKFFIKEFVNEMNGIIVECIIPHKNILPTIDKNKCDKKEIFFVKSESNKPIERNTKIYFCG